MSAIERVRADLKGALRILNQESFGLDEAVLVEQLIGLALTDLNEAGQTEGGTDGE